MVSEDRKDAQRRRDIGVRGSKEIRLNQKKGDRQRSSKVERQYR